MKTSQSYEENISENRPRHIAAFDTMRIIGCLLVLLIHVSAQWTDAALGESTAALVFSLGCNMLGFCSLPLFIMISGALYLSPERQHRGTSLSASGKAADGFPLRMAARSWHFIWLYFVWKLFYLLEDCVMEPELLARDGFKKHVILALFQTAGKYHLWYLPMLAVLLFLSPVIVHGVQDPRVRLMYLIPSGLLSVFLPTAFQFEFPFKYLLMDFRNLFDLSYFTGYLGYFILGYALWKVRLKKPGHEILILTLIAVSSWIAGLAYAVRRSLGDGAVFYGFSSPFALHSASMAAVMFVILVQREKKDIDAVSVSNIESDPQNTEIVRNDGLTWNRRIRRCKGCRASLSRASFGIYLVHPFILDLLTKAGIQDVLPGPVCGIPVLLAVVLVLSWLFVTILIRIPLLRKPVS